MLKLNTQFLNDGPIFPQIIRVKTLNRTAILSLEYLDTLREKNIQSQYVPSRSTKRVHRCFKKVYGKIYFLRAKFPKTTIHRSYEIFFLYIFSQFSIELGHSG